MARKRSTFTPSHKHRLFLISGAPSVYLFSCHHCKDGSVITILRSDFWSYS